MARRQAAFRPPLRLRSWRRSFGSGRLPDTTFNFIFPRGWTQRDSGKKEFFFHAGPNGRITVSASRDFFLSPLSWMLGAALGTLLPWTWIPAVFVLVVQTLQGFLLFALVRRFVSSYSAALLGTVAYAANPYAPAGDLYPQRLCGIACDFVLSVVAARGRSGLVDFWKRMLPAKNPSPIRVSVCCSVAFECACGRTGELQPGACCFSAGATQRKFQPALRGAGGLALGLGLAAFI